MILGCHVSFLENQLLGCAKLAVSYGANAFMFYTGAPQNTRRREIDLAILKEAQEYMVENQININHVICHAPYLINLANRKEEQKWLWAIDFLKNEIKRCELMGIEKIVLHPGSAVGMPKEEGIQNIIDALNMTLTSDTNCIILLETMAGKGTECGSTLEEIQMILDNVIEKKNMGVCIDTCHLNDAGYNLQDFDTFLETFDKIIGLEKLFCVHLNDSKNMLGAHKDRHENIGYGKIPFETLLKICHHPKLKDVPKILETPFVGMTDKPARDYPPYKFEIEMLKKQELNSHLYEDIRNYYRKDL